jgi:hypothetical protein
MLNQVTSFTPKHLDVARTKCKESFIGMNLHLGSKGMLKSASVPKGDFNYSAFSNELTSNINGKSKIANVKTQAANNEKDWYSFKLNRILGEMRAA